MIAGLILAGGQGRRLGTVEKGLILLAGQTLLALGIAQLRQQVDRIAISGRASLAEHAEGLPILPDGPFEGHGPLAGLLAGLEWAAGQGATSLLTLPVDTPFIPTDLAARLNPAPACAVSRGRTHHLVALWPISAASALRNLLVSGSNRAVTALTEQLGCRTVTFAEDPDPFTNINTPDDLAIAAARLP